MKHPEVMELFRMFANHLLRAGRKRGSADQIIQRIRWETAVNPERDEKFKINDHFSSRYARRLMGEDPRFKDFFEIRGLSGS